MPPVLEEGQSTPDADTRTLVRLTRQGDGPARDTLILFWLDKAYRYTAGRKGQGISKEDLRDILLDAVLDAIDAADPAHSSEYLDGLLFLTIRGKVSDHRDKWRRRAEIDASFNADASSEVQRGERDQKDQVPVSPPGTSWVNPDPDDPTFLVERRDVRHVLENMPEDECEILTLRVMEEVPMHKCQEIMGLTEHECRKLHKIALASFKDRYTRMKTAGSP